MEQKKSLVSIVSDTNDIVSQLIENGGELPPDLEEKFLINKNELAVKTDSYAYMLERLELEESYWKAKANDMALISKSLKGLRERLKDRLKYALSNLEEKEIKGDDYRFKLSNAKGKLVIDDEKIISDEYKYQKVSMELDKDKIKEDLAKGVKIEGARIEESSMLRKYLNKKGAK